jgi:hypothetical protein
LLDLAIMLFVAILVVTLWWVGDTLNLTVSLLVAVVLVLGRIVIDRSDRPVAADRRIGGKHADARPR